MNDIRKSAFLHEIKPHIKDIIEEIFIDSVKKGELRELLEDLLLAKAMEEVENEKDLSYDEALNCIEWK